MSEAHPVYLFLGPEEGMKSDEVSSLKKRVAHRAGGEVDEHRFYLPDDDIEASVDVLRNGSLFSAHRFVIVSGIEQIRKKSDIDTLLAYLKSPNEESTLVLVSDSVRIDARLDKAVPAEHKKIFWEMFENQKNSWVHGYFRKRHIEITPEAVELFLEIVENNTQELRNEADKLCTFVGPDGSVGPEEIDTFIYHSREESVFTLFAYVVTGNFEAAVQVVDKLMSAGETGPVQLIGGLIFQLRRLLALRQFVDNGVALETAFSRLNIRGKRIQQEYRNGMEKFSAADIEDAIHLLSEYDALFRSERPGIHNLLAHLMTYQLFYHSTRLVNPDAPYVEHTLIGERGDDQMR